MSKQNSLKRNTGLQKAKTDIKLEKKKFIISVVNNYFCSCLLILLFWKCQILETEQITKMSEVFHKL